MFSGTLKNGELRAERACKGGWVGKATTIIKNLPWDKEARVLKRQCNGPRREGGEAEK